jgi:hypothetical protein
VPPGSGHGELCGLVEEVLGHDTTVRTATGSIPCPAARLGQAGPGRLPWQSRCRRVDISTWTDRREVTAPAAVIGDGDALPCHVRWS